MSVLSSNLQRALRIHLQEVARLSTGHENEDGWILLASHLRFLLCERPVELEAWLKERAPGCSICVEVPSIEYVIARVPQEWLTVAIAGGASVKGGEVRGSTFTEHPVANKFIQAHVKGINIAMLFGGGGPPRGTCLRVGRLAEQTCFVIKGARYSRKVLVKYVANKRGGVHSDEDVHRNDRERKFYRDIADIEQWQFFGQDAVLYEVLATGQALMRCEAVVASLDC